MAQARLAETWVTLLVRRVLEGFEPAGLVIEVSKIKVHEADEPNVLAHLFDADALAGEDDPETDFQPIGTSA